MFQIRWTKTAGSVSDRFQDSSVFNETLIISKILRTQGGRYYCKAENGLGSPAIKSIRVDVYCVGLAHAHSLPIGRFFFSPLAAAVVKRCWKRRGGIEPGAETEADLS
uniref:Ig-like domain-containing protein n=1 Tax=Knipowitschia caucasica TaxID=637954 RepID=A0AAV2KD91_KNICA